MEYVLIILLQFKKFKNNLKLNLFTDNFFIDELVLDESINLKKKNWSIHDFQMNFKKFNKNYNRDFYEYFYKEFCSRKKSSNYYCPFPTKIFLYHLNGNYLGRELKLRFNDSNTNYTNGFMTQSNIVMFEKIYLLPKNCLQMTSMVSLFNRYPDYKDKFNQYIRKKNKGNSLSCDVNTYNIPWPSNGSHYRSLQDSYIDYSKPQQLRNQIWYGGKLELYIPLVKKHGIHMIDGNKFSRPTDVPIRVTVDQLFWHHLTHYKLINT